MSSTMVDWTVALNTARKLVKAGPEISAQGAAEAVASLRVAAGRAEAYVTEVTGLETPSATAPVLVVDRPGWIQANLDGFRHVLAPLAAKAALRAQNPALVAVGARVTGVEVGALLSYLAPKVLGQFDPFFPGASGQPGGRLLLVAPNIVAVERELDVTPADFRLWVCLHEETHRVQFTAVPWMREHMFGQIQKFAETMEPSGMLEDGLTRVLEGLKNARSGGSSGASLLDVVGTPEQKALLDGLTGVMSLLEGHADVVMDGVGPTVIPSVAKIRARFNERRKGVGVLDRVLRRVLGLDAKMAQYRDGAAFVRGVVDKAGMSGFNVVWEQPDHLPTKAEIADPDAWMSRVLRS
jgi:coenzyme F420 biosynthesis associated uncharacterized protein